MLRGALVARFYYIYAVDYDRGGEWSGQAYMCTRDKEFTIQGTEDCLARGFDRTGFFEVDTGEQPTWTVQLDRIGRAGADDAAAVPHPADPDAAGAAPSNRTHLRRHEAVTDATSAPDQDRRHPRPGVLRQDCDREACSAPGADVFRINMSHTTHERMRELVAAIRAVETEHGRPIGILVDLQGPKLRVGSFAAGPAMLAQGDTFVLDADPAPGDAKRVHLPHPEIFAALEPGHALLLDDGKMRLTAIEVGNGRIVTARRGRRQAVRPQGREPARHRRRRSRR